MNDEIFDDLFSEDMLEDESSSNTQQTEAQAFAQKHGLGGFDAMNEKERAEFRESDEFKNYSAEIDNQNIKANMNGKSVQEILGLSDLKNEHAKSFNAFEHYDVDIDFYQDIVDSSPVMQDTIKRGVDIFPTFEYMYQDIFLSLYKYKAKLLPESEIYMSTRINRKFAECYLNTPEYIKLRQTCRMDQFNAALGTEIIGNKLLKVVEEVVDKMKQQQEAIDKMKQLMKQEQQMDDLVQENQNLDDLLQQMQQMGQGNSAQAQQLQQQIDSNNLTRKQAEALAQTIADEMDDLVNANDIAGQIITKAGKAFDEASEQVAETSQMVNAWGFGEGEKSRISYQNKKDAIERIRSSRKLKELTDLIGKFKESAVTEQKKKTKHGAVEIDSVTTGRKIEDTLPSERMLLSNDTTKGDFYNRYSEGRLMTYSKQSNKSKNKGPIILCCDESGSMSGDSETWSKAFTMGVLEIAQIQKRDFAFIAYSGNANDPIIIKKGEISPNKVITICEEFIDGGTNFERPLKKAMELIKTSQFKEADIMFVTDGDCGVSEDFKRKFKTLKEDKEFSCKGILIDMGRWSSSSATLEEFCDDIIHISSIADLKDADSNVNKQLFGSI